MSETVPAYPNSYTTPLSNQTFPLIIPRGWECPKCGAIYSPWVQECDRCNKMKYGYPKSTGGG